MHICVLMDEREILSLLLGVFGLLLPPACLWAEDINHFPVIKNNDVFLSLITAGFNQPLTLSFALLLDLVHCVFAEVYLVAAVAEIGREKYFLWHGSSLPEDCGKFNEIPEPLCPGSQPEPTVNGFQLAGMRRWMSLVFAVGRRRSTSVT